MTQATACRREIDFKSGQILCDASKKVSSMYISDL